MDYEKNSFEKGKVYEKPVCFCRKCNEHIVICDKCFGSFDAGDNVYCNGKKHLCKYCFDDLKKSKQNETVG